MNLSKIGFYTLKDERVINSSRTSSLMRCELILTGQCNFSCPYCRNVGGKNLPFNKAKEILEYWFSQNLRNVRFSGGEPTIYPHLFDLVKMCKDNNVERIAVSTNGSASKVAYDQLIQAGVNDFSVSLDACCAADGDKMAGNIPGSWNIVVDNIRYLSTKTYVTVGVVLTSDNVGQINKIIEFADSLGVSDIRIIPAAQFDNRLYINQIDKRLLDKYPILNYRIQNIKDNKNVRGIGDSDSSRCGLVMDDMAVMGENHYPCIIYMREGGLPIGKIGANTRKDREAWYKNHNCHEDKICKNNCLDVCVEFNNKYRQYHE